MDKKKIFKVLFCIFLLCFSFFLGIMFSRYIISRGVESDSDGIKSTESAIRDEFSNAESSGTNGVNLLNGAEQSGQLSVTVIEQLQSANEKQRVCIDEIKRQVENNIRVTEAYAETNRAVSDATEYALSLAILQSEQYEQLIGDLQQTIRNYEENSGEQQ